MEEKKQPTPANLSNGVLTKEEQNDLLLESLLSSVNRNSRNIRIIKQRLDRIEAAILKI